MLAKRNYWLLFSLLVLSIGVTSIGCGDDDDSAVGEGDTDTDTDSDSDTDTDTDTDSDADTGTPCLDCVITATIKLPSEFSDTPKQIGVVFYETNVPTGMPNATGDTIDEFVIGPDTPYQLSTSTAELAGMTGSYYLGVVVYVDAPDAGTAGGAPREGVDWIGFSTDPVAIPLTDDVDAGEIMLEVYQL